MSYVQSEASHVMNTPCTPADYIAELERQSAQVATLAAGLSELTLNWQPSPQSWSIGQCLDHLVLINGMMLDAMRASVEENRDQLKPRQGPIEAQSAFMRWYLGFSEPPPRRKILAPKKIAPSSRIPAGIVPAFNAAQRRITAFVEEFGSADLSEITYKVGFLPVVWLSVDTGLALIAAHNRRHLWQAEQVKKSAGFPQQ